MLPRFLLDLHLLSSVYLLSLTFNPLQHGGKHSQSFSPFCDSISADIAAVSLDSSIRSDEDAAREIYSLAIEKERGGERQKEMEGIGGIESENWYVWYEEEKKGGS